MYLVLIYKDLLHYYNYATQEYLMESSMESSKTPLMQRSRSNSTAEPSVRHGSDRAEKEGKQYKRTLTGAYRRPSLCSAGTSDKAQGGPPRRVSVLDRGEARALSAASAGSVLTGPRQPALSISKSVSGYAQERQFDKKLQEKAAVKMDAKAAKRHKFQKKWLSGMKNVVIVFYFLVVPMLETPNWCLDWFRPDRHKLPGICIPCQEAQGGIIRYSGLPKLQPAVSYSIDIFCLIVLGVFKAFKMSWKKTAGSEKARIWGFLAVELVCIADLVHAGYYFRYPFINNLLRPVVVVVFFSTIRENLKTLAKDLKDSLVILASILVYILYFSAVGLFIFQGTMTGYASFTTLGETFWSLIILITTSNYPDVMLYAYNTSTWYTLYFVVFILFGVFFLMNVLLGVIFDNYKRHVELSSRNRSKRRMKIIERYYRQFDEEGKGYLTIVQAREFFALALDLNYHKRAHRDTLRQTLKIIDPEGNRILLRDRILEFFEIGGFAMLPSLEQEQQNLDLSQDPQAEESELTDTDASFQANERAC